MIKCGCGCGASIVFETKKKYYKRTNRWAEYTYARSSKRCGKCTQKGISLVELETQILEKIEEVTIDNETWKLGVELVQAKYKKEAKDLATIVINRQREYQRLQDELNGYFKMRAKEEISAEEFQQKKQEIIELQNGLQEKIDNGTYGQRHWLELMGDYLNTVLQARNMLVSGDLYTKRKTVQRIGWNLLLKDKKLVWTYQKPYDVLLKPAYRSNLRGFVRWILHPDVTPACAGRSISG